MVVGSGRIGTSIGGAEQGGDFIRDGAFAISSAMSSSTRPASVSENRGLPTRLVGCHQYFDSDDVSISLSTWAATVFQSLARISTPATSFVGMDSIAIFWGAARQMVARPEELVVTLHWASLHAFDDSIELPDLESLLAGRRVPAQRSVPGEGP